MNLRPLTLASLQARLHHAQGEEARWQLALEADASIPSGLEIVITHSPEHHGGLLRRAWRQSPERVLSLIEHAPELLDTIPDVIEQLPGSIFAERVAGKILGARSTTRPSGIHPEQVVRILRLAAARDLLSPRTRNTLLMAADRPGDAATPVEQPGQALRILLADRTLSDETLSLLAEHWSTVPDTALLLALHPTWEHSTRFEEGARRNPDAALNVCRTSRIFWHHAKAQSWLQAHLRSLHQHDNLDGCRPWALAALQWITERDLQPLILTTFAAGGGLPLYALVHLTPAKVALNLSPEHCKVLLMSPYPEVREMGLKAIRQKNNHRKSTETPPSQGAALR